MHEIKAPSKLSLEELEEYEEDIKLMRDWYATEIFDEQQLLQDQEKSIEAARKMLSLGLSDEIILEVSGIARVELKKMKNEK